MGGRLFTSRYATQSFFLRDDGELYVWGDWDMLQFLGNTRVPKLLPSVYFGEGKKIKEVLPGRHFTIVLMEDGSLYSWGEGHYGILGFGVNKNVLEPVELSWGNFNGEKVKKIVIGLFHVVVLTESGDVFTWGLNSVGQLGLGYHGRGLYEGKPCRLDLGVFNGELVVDIYAGSASSFFITEQGNLYACGSEDIYIYEEDATDVPLCVFKSAVEGASVERVDTNRNIYVGESTFYHFSTEDSLFNRVKGDSPTIRGR